MASILHERFDKRAERTAHALPTQAARFVPSDQFRKLGVGRGLKRPSFYNSNISLKCMDLCARHQVRKMEKDCVGSVLNRPGIAGGSNS